jgi:hypothetical protein
MVKEKFGFIALTHNIERVISIKNRRDRDHNQENTGNKALLDEFHASTG